MDAGIIWSYVDSVFWNVFILYSACYFVWETVFFIHTFKKYVLDFPLFKIRQHSAPTLSQYC